MILRLLIPALLALLISPAQLNAQQISPSVNLRSTFMRMKKIEEQLAPGIKEELQSQREEMQKNAKELMKPVTVCTKMLLELGMKPDRGSTEHKDNENAQKGIEDTKLILISEDLILKKYAPVEQAYPGLSEAEKDHLQCDLTIATMLHEWKHATSDQGKQSEKEDAWELCAYNAEKFWLVEILGNMPEYTQQPLFGAIESEIDAICKRIQGLNGGN